ncbi:77 kDa echinoderm microtubule-associated protein isoform X2 [Strongylocentrotus purpuratus]|uniref:Doublecortin domain-containing protein n=1 Tax=Strongylocentrotus purpuratus TaxID=7668 RepID=A0A7M7NWV4_STRPU|nr:77 kDa echinoderm microtubule-associated protein isoform X2 [Strongylocentrotus purpuratus]
MRIAIFFRAHSQRKSEAMNIGKARKQWRRQKALLEANSHFKQLHQKRKAAILRLSNHRMATPESDDLGYQDDWEDEEETDVAHQQPPAIRRPPREEVEDDYEPRGDAMFDLTPPQVRRNLPPAPKQQHPRQGKFTTKVVTFYRNGDKHFKGITLPVSIRNYSTMDVLKHFLTGKVALSYGVRKIYSLSGLEVQAIEDFVDGRAYVCSSGKFSDRTPYGRADHTNSYWSTEKPMKGVRGSDRNLIINESDPTNNVLIEEFPTSRFGKFARRLSVNAVTQNPSIEPQVAQWAKPRVIQIVSNTHRASRAKILINPKTSQTFDDVLKDMSQAIMMHNPPVRKLFTWRTEDEVLSFTQLFRDFKDQSMFIACGYEPLKRTSNLGRQRDEADDLNASADRIVMDDIIDDYPKPSQRGPSMAKVGRYAMMYQDWKRFKDKRWKKEEETVQPAYPARSMIPVRSREPPLPPMKPRKAFLSNSQDSATTDESLELMDFEEETGKPARGVRIMEGRMPYNLRESKQRLLDKRIQIQNSPDLSQSEDQVEEDHQGSSKNTKPQGARRKEKKHTKQQHQPKKFLPAPMSVEVHGQLREFLPPSEEPKKQPDSPPKKKLKLEWVYGYRGFDMRNNLYVLPSGELLYTVGAVAILYDRDLDEQRHYLGHNEDIQSIAVHPSGTYIATGQKAGQLPDSTPSDVAACHCAHVRVWEVQSLCTHAILGLEFFSEGIACLSFSNENDGEWLMAVEQGNDHVISVWQWKEDCVYSKSSDYTLYDAASNQASSDAVVCGAFHPFDDTTMVIAGRQHLYFWTLTDNRLVRDKRSGTWDGEKPAYVTCIEFSHTGDVLTGDSNGSITVWEKDTDFTFKLRYMVQHAHERSVFALCMLDDGTLLSGGGLDRRLLAWDSHSGYTSSKVERLFPENAGGIRTIAPLNPGSPDGLIAIGTTRNHVMEGSLQTKFKYVLQGHSEELWSLAAHPTKPVFATAGYDQHVISWRADVHRCSWKVHVEKCCVCCAFSQPSGNVLAVGTTGGRFMIHSSEDGLHITSVQLGKEQIDVIQYSSDGSLLALGSHDHCIHIFSVMDEGHVYRKLGVLEGHGSFITHLDWSDDGAYLQSVSGNYDLLFWDIDNLQRVKAGTTRDVEWDTHSCILGYSVLGIWPGQDKGTDVDTLARSTKNRMLVAGNNIGAISAYRYPCTSYKARSTDIKHHSSHVTAIDFLYNDHYVITAGGHDAVIMQFTLVDKMGDKFDNLADSL